MEENGAPALFIQGDTGDYVAYEPPAPKAFHETLPEDIRENEHLKDVSDPAQLANAYVEMKSSIVQPPDSAEQYEFTPPEGFELDEPMLNSFKEVALQNKLSQAQFNEFMNFETDRHQQAVESMNKSMEDTKLAAETELKTEWGAEYDKNVESARQFLNQEQVADDGFKKFLEDTRFGDNPQVIRMFAKLSKLISEDGFIKPGTGDKDVVRLGEDGRPMLSFPSMEE